MQVSRRELLSRSGLGFAGLTMQALATDATAATSDRAASTVPHFAPRAKRVIHLFMNGGPSHVDTFDPKPMLDRYAGQALPMENLRTERRTGAALPSPFRFRQFGESGTPVSELFPCVAKCVNDMAVIRSMHADVPNHEPSLMLMNCGDARQIRPSLGSWLTYGLGTENRNLPSFVAMCPGGYPIQESQNWQAGFLPGMSTRARMSTQSNKDAGPKLIEQHSQSAYLSPNASSGDNSISCVHAINRERAFAINAAMMTMQLEARIQSFELAYRMQKRSCRCLRHLARASSRSASSMDRALQARGRS